MRVAEIYSKYYSSFLLGVISYFDMIYILSMFIYFTYIFINDVFLVIYFD